MANNNSNSTGLSDWLAYYQILIDDVKYAKGQQWHVSYYILILLSAAIGLSKILSIKPVTQIVLFVFSCILATVGTLILSRFQKDLRRYRENISKVRSKFPEDLHDIANYEPAEEDPSYYAFVLYVQIATIWVAVGFAGWAIGFWKLLFCN